MDFGQFGGFWAQFLPETCVLPTFQPDHQVSPESRSSMDSKALLSWNMQKFDDHIPSPSFLNWPIILLFQGNTSMKIRLKRKLLLNLLMSSSVLQDL